jgi:hypothetical protein
MRFRYSQVQQRFESGEVQITRKRNLYMTQFMCVNGQTVKDTLQLSRNFNHKTMHTYTLLEYVHRKSQMVSLTTEFFTGHKHKAFCRFLFYQHRGRQHSEAHTWPMSLVAALVILSTC